MERNDKYFIDSAKVRPCLHLRKWNRSVWNGSIEMEDESVTEIQFSLAFDA